MITRSERRDVRNGRELKIIARNDKVMVDKAKVIETDIMISNGVIHMIDAAVLP